MRKVKNRKVIHRIADKTRKAQKGRNFIAVLAIMLTSLMFTVVFLVGASLVKKGQESTMRQVGGSAHAGYKYLTQEEYETVKKDPEIKEISYRITVGDLANESLKKLPTEISYYEDLDAKWAFCYPTYGHMPQKEEELVTSDLVLRRLGIDCKIGEKVPLAVSIGSKTVKKTFILCGYFTGDPIAMAQVALVSREFQEKVAPVPAKSVMKGVFQEDDYAGRIMADFNFGSSLMLEKQVEKLSKRCGFPKGENVGVNWAYMGYDMDIEGVVMLAVLLFVILLSGYLIIYNIFYINVYQDIVHYGLLKTIGTTGKQLRCIVHRQAYMLSLYGIPIGLCLGAFAGNMIFPMVMGELSFAKTIDNSIEWNGWIFAGAALFSFGTVYISCIKPCRIASRVTAIEAVRYTEGQEQYQFLSRKKAKHGVKKTGHITLRALAWQNVQRSRRKIVIVVASLSLALVLLNSIYSLVKGFDMEQYVSPMIVSDFSVSDATLDNFSVDLESVNTEGVTAKFLKELKQQEGITECGNIYLNMMDCVQFTDEEYALFEERIFESSNPAVQDKLSMYSEGMEKEYFDSIRKERLIDGNIYGIGKLELEKLDKVEGKLDWEKFSTGRYVIGTRFGWSDGQEDEEVSFFEPGEKVTLCNKKGDSRQYEVLAVADIPYSWRYRHFGMFDCDFILPEKEYLDFIGKQQPMRTLFNVEKEKQEKVEQWLSDYCELINDDLTYTSKKKVEEEFNSYKNLIVVVGNLLSFVLACIGILNFINTIETSILSRKREFAMMEAVGMTGRQLKQMLCFEGGYYALLTALVSGVLASVLSVTVVRFLGDEMYFFHWKYTITPIIVCIPVLIVVVLAVPVLSYRRICCSSVVERMRKTE